MQVSMELLVVLGTIAITGLILGLISSIVGLISLAKVIGMEKSTHSVQLMPVDEDIDKINNEYLKEWGTKEESFDQLKKEYSEELEEKMPEFMPSDEDKEIYSF